MSDSPSIPLEPLASVHSESLTEILIRLNASLLVSTYQAGKIVIARVQDQVINTHFRTFHMPMGMTYGEGKLAIGARGRIWDFRDQIDVARKLEPAGQHDAAFLPRNCHFTGDIQVHEIAWGGNELWVVNTRFSCLCTIDSEHSFVPRWRPRFVSGLSPEDRCHLNGLGMRDGRPRYATALGETDGRGGWRANKRDGGCLIDVDSGEIVSQRLSMPHSPRWHNGRRCSNRASDRSARSILQAENATSWRFYPASRAASTSRGHSPSSGFPRCAKRLHLEACRSPRAPMSATAAFGSWTFARVGLSRCSSSKGTFTKCSLFKCFKEFVSPRSSSKMRMYSRTRSSCRTNR